MASEFLPGLELAGRYYREVVRPLLDQGFPGLRHSAALVGWGSDVLGFDSPRSTDHNWGPRCQVFIGPADAGLADDVTAMLAGRLPETFFGWPTRFTDVTARTPGARHWVEVAEAGAWLTGRLGFDPRAGVSTLDWLATPTQVLAEVTGGAVFSDGLGTPADSGPADSGPAGRAQSGGLRAARAALAWYPDDIWRYVLACQWARIGQEEAFPGRCAEVGDDLGSVVVTARLARDPIRLALLIHRRYPPYSKWLGSAFARLPGAAAVLRPRLAAAVTAGSWRDRQQNLCDAYEAVAGMHNDLGLTGHMNGSVRPFYDRPFLVIDAGRFVSALIDSISLIRSRRTRFAVFP